MSNENLDLNWWFKSFRCLYCMDQYNRILIAEKDVLLKETSEEARKSFAELQEFYLRDIRKERGEQFEINAASLSELPLADILKAADESKNLDTLSIKSTKTFPLSVNDLLYAAAELLKQEGHGGWVIQLDKKVLEGVDEKKFGETVKPIAGT